MSFEITTFLTSNSSDLVTIFKTIVPNSSKSQFWTESENTHIAFGAKFARNRVAHNRVNDSRAALRKTADHAGEQEHGEGPREAPYRIGHGEASLSNINVQYSISSIIMSKYS